jgi:hypothetical protein
MRSMRRLASCASGDLLDRMIRPEIVYHDVSRKGDVLIIDNRATTRRRRHCDEVGAHGDGDRLPRRR